MIKIEPNNIRKIENSHYIGVKKLILDRIDFYLHVFKVIDRQPGFNVASLNGHTTYEFNTKTKLIKILGRKKTTFSKKKDYAKLLRRNSLSVHFYNHRANYIALLTSLSNGSNLENLILADWDNLTIEEAKYIHAWYTGDSISFLSLIFPYDQFIDKKNIPYNAYDLSAVLNVSTCPYCNRNNTSTIIGSGQELIIRPAFDHFFSKGIHPLLSLSLYNLIPACDPCNSTSLKGEIQFSLTTHIHPYKEGFSGDAQFDYLQIGYYPDKTDPRNYQIILRDNCGFDGAKRMKIFGDKNTNPKWGNVEVFKIREVYQAHTDVIGELIVKADKDSPYHATSLFKSLPQFKSNKKEFYRFYFSNYFDESDFNRRPLAKLTRDFVNKYLPEFNV